MSSMRVLVVGRHCPMTEQLETSGHHVTPVEECNIAVEALQLQNFDAVVLGQDISPSDLEALAREVDGLNRRSSIRTAVIGIQPDCNPFGTAVKLDGYLPVHAGAEALSEVLARSAAAPSSASPELPVLNPDDLREQLDFDNELLLELVELYHSERKRQTPEMREALAKGDLMQLSRIAHTMKGSLGSLQAPSARAAAQQLEMAAAKNDRAVCEKLLPLFETKLDELDIELDALTHSVLESR
jgi:two-component system sensor histidine kinase/response regulator